MSDLSEHKYGFEVDARYERRWDYAARKPYPNYDRPTYQVYLPHSCDEWMIIFEKTKKAAVAEMERFIIEAQLALTKLRGLPDELPRDSPPDE